MFYSCDQSPVSVELNTVATKRAELIGNIAIVQKCSVIHKKATCVCLRLPVAASCAERRGDLWPA